MTAIPIVRPDLGPCETAALERVMASGWVMQGPEVAAFEREFAAQVGCRQAVAVANGTVALELALRVLGVGPGDEVITVSHSFIATANSVAAVGATPVFVDVEETTYGLDPRALPAALSPRTRAILCVHQFGIPCRLAEVLAFGEAHGLPVVEDAACALGSRLRLPSDQGLGPWEPVGRPHGRLACFSFHPRKIITTGEGGMIACADEETAERLRALRQHGMREGLCIERGFNARLSDLHAAIGRTQLARLDRIVRERQRLATLFSEALQAHPVLQALVPGAEVQCNWQSFPTRLRPEGGWSQEGVLAFLREQGLACQGGIVNAHEQPAYEGAAAPSGGQLPVSERLRRQTVLVPLFHGMTPDEEAQVVEALGALASAAPRP